MGDTNKHHLMKHYFNAFRHYADFSGRASRTEFWMFVLINSIISWGIVLLFRSSVSILPGLYLLATFIPGLAIMVRRLQDAGKSGWYILLAFIPLIGTIWLIYLLCQASQGEDIAADIADGILAPFNEEYQRASIEAVKCPHCGGESFTFKGEDGALSSSLTTAFLFGAVGELVTASSAKKNVDINPLKYKCNSCRKSFLTKPGQAADDELLSEPCTVHFKRMSNILGAAVPFLIYLNGVKISPVKNGKVVSFYTYVKKNVIFVTDHHGLPFKNSTSAFEAEPGGHVTIRRYRTNAEVSVQTKAAAPAPSNQPKFPPYSGSGVCDVCNQPLYDRKAYIVPNFAFYSSAKWRTHFKQMTTRMHGFPITDAEINNMRDSDRSPGSAVCQDCIHLFD